MKKITAYIKKFVGVRKLALILLLFFSVVSVGGSIAMLSGDNLTSGHTSCPVIGHAQALCQMGPVEHVGSWKAMFISLPAQFINLVLLAISLAFIAFFFVKANYELPPGRSLKLHIKDVGDLKLYNYFIVLFSRGVLHSQTYS